MPFTRRVHAPYTPLSVKSAELVDSCLGGDKNGSKANGRDREQTKEFTRASNLAANVEPLSCNESGESNVTLCGESVAEVAVQANPC